MKRPYFSLLSAIVVAAMTLTACGNSTNSDKDNNSGIGSEPSTGVEPAEPDAGTSSGISGGGSGTELFTDILGYSFLEPERYGRVTCTRPRI